MSRTLSLAMTSYLSGPLLALATCVKVTRLDGLIFGFTSLDRDIVVDGINYEAETSVNASELRQSVGAGVDNLDVVSLVTSARITEVDLRAGRWDGARVELFFVNFEDTTMGRIVLLSGYFGEISHNAGQYKAEIRSLSQRLSSQIGDLTSALCRVRQLFDSVCMPKGTNENGIGGQDGTLTPASFRFTASVFSVTSLFVITFGGPTSPVGGETKASGYYSYGRIAFTTGLNAGLQREVKSHLIVTARAQMTLQEPFPFLVSPGDTALIEAGCDRTFGVCYTTFLNAYNFAGENSLPGNDALQRRGKR
jgi:uncharacterized phage protein (TIGR02218 family)